MSSPISDTASAPSIAPAAEAAAPARGRKAGAAIAVAAVVIGAYFGIRHWQFAAAHEETDDAQVQGHISPVLPRVSGYVARVLVDDNQRVAAGQALVEIDSRDLDLKVDSAVAGLRAAEAAERTAEAAVFNARAAESAAVADAATARVLARKAAEDLARDQRLFRGSAITDLQLSDSQAAADVAAGRAIAADRKAEAARAQIAVAEAQVGAARAEVSQRRSELDYARLQRSYTVVSAPISGFVSQKDVEVGQFVQAGQTLLSVAQDTGCWVVANFKETQVGRMHAGQPAEFTVAGYSGLVVRGHVDSLAGATGARFALLPPDNASGNFVKVTQRVPVKILVDGDPAAILRPGVSVDVTVTVKD